MADDRTVGEEVPSILVRYAGNTDLRDSTNRLDLFPFDDGGPRYVLKGNTILVSQKDLKILNGYNIERVEVDSPVDVVGENVNTTGQSPEGDPELTEHVINESVVVDQPAPADGTAPAEQNIDLNLPGQSG